ncbi:hypothetical protein HMPREF9709_00956 [Helcococcus kunzii ATCC 51366]|uniref:CvpA family protein n=1 Tax=Helcococcus kunzii ATCC 51366 TaxID=883114 RepID=H3NNP5_9FIRM|nr:hypothetical protein [Helcococcus kunzii]EHR34020.1 hypothetical protein HMPREF9709_00956 [Helcococcus kunzii ATCC 51366]MCT1795628.1 hypothetical protein [Helcococcus kunzii]MCT1988806.1 hypothetical protein [Helcococcus kunzii]
MSTFDGEFNNRPKSNYDPNFDFKDFFNDIDNKVKSRFKKFRSTQKKAAIFLAIAFAVIYYYFLLPPLNIRSVETWLYVIMILGILVIIGGRSIKSYKILRKVFVGLIVLLILLKIPGLKIFSSKSYANIIKVTNSDFKSDIKELPVNEIPTLDRDSSIKLGSRKMGELLDLVSQFDIDEETYTQINYQGKPVRVTPLKYNNFIKYLFNMSEGIPGFLKIDIVDGDAELQKLDKKIKISKEDYFFRDVRRFVRLRYPFEIFKEINFEIDDNGVPYWVIPTYSPKIFMFDALDVNGAILVNASTGEHTRYDLKDIPEWLDRIFYASDIIEQLDWHGMYQNGFINSLFAQKNVLKTTEGYNYLALNDDVYLYTGFTSVAGDESNVGFILSNLRTKETKFYPVSSAKEISAMESAKGAVQEKNYNATFPLLLNIKGEPTYFLSLKDNAGLIKNYAFIDAKNYQRVSIGSSVQQAMTNHLANMASTTEQDKEKPKEELINKKGKISDIKEVVIDGNTHYYFMLEKDDNVYVTNISLSENLPFVKTGQEIEFVYNNDNVKEVVQIMNIK